MKYTTVYDYSQITSSDTRYLYLLIPVLLIVLSSVLVKKEFLSANAMKNKKNKAVKISIAILFIFSCVCMIVVSLYLSKPSAEREYKNKIYTVSGEVSEFHPAKMRGFDNEKFIVNDVCFSYCYEKIWYPGYLKTYYHNGLIRKNGQKVKITYYYNAKYMQNIILKIEIPIINRSAK